MKKTTYLAPETTITEIEVSNIMSSSITGIGGDTEIEMGEGEAPGEADSRRRNRNDWEDEEYDDEEDW